MKSSKRLLATAAILLMAMAVSSQAVQRLVLLENQTNIG